MNLISCEQCGVVLDKDKLIFPDNDLAYNEDGEIRVKYMRWNGSEYTPYTSCPVCNGDILETDYDR